MKKVFAILLLCLCLAIPRAARAAALDVLITEVQTESATSASEEYIVIANNSARVVDLSGWHLQYFSATASTFNTPVRNVALQGVLLPHDTLMVASSGYKSSVAKASFGATLASAGGHLRLMSGNGATEVQHDVLGWGTALHPEGAAVAEAAKGQLYQRKANQYGTFVDTDNNAADFTNGTLEEASAGTDSAGDGIEAPASSSVLFHPVLTELLPDPASPTTDAEGEFVELYNPSSEAIDLAGYKLQTGSTYSYSYTFKEGTIAAGAYQAFYASQTKLTLSNTSGQARLLNLSGETVSETAPYSKAITGSSWVLDGDTWKWTAAPSPNAATGVIIDPTAATSATAAKKATAVKVATKPKTTTTKAVTKKTTTAKAAKAPTTTKSTSYKNPAGDKKALPVNPFLLAVVGVPLLGYVVYEYRHDMGNFFAKFRRHRSARRETSAVSAGR